MNDVELSRNRAILHLTILDNPYIPRVPTKKQIDFLLDDHLEILYGGAGGGGKSEALLMAALQYVDFSKYSALLLRQTYSDLSLAGALMDRSHEWLINTGARWSEKNKTWTFISGSKLTFGYLERKNDHYRYQSSEFHYIGFDELTQFTEEQYRFLFSRLRKKKGDKIPLRMRAASNPVGKGYEWVKRRFITSQAEDRIYIPATLYENPHIDQEGYVKNLMHLDPVTRQKILEGDWEAREPGDVFQREWFEIVDDYPENDIVMLRWWDTAATPATEGKDPDWTVGVLLLKYFDGTYWVLDVKRMRGRPKEVQDMILKTAKQDGPKVRIRMGKEPGSSGEHMIEDYKEVLKGFQFEGIRETGSKFSRAQPVSSAAEQGKIKLVQGDWNGPFLNSIETFSEDQDSYAHDDDVDALSGAYAEINKIPLRAATPVYDLEKRDSRNRTKREFEKEMQKKKSFRSATPPRPVA